MNVCNYQYVSLNIKFRELCKHLQENFKTNIYKEVIHIIEGDSDVFIFEYGAVVFWNAGYDIEQSFLDLIKNYSENQVDERIRETLQYIEDQNETVRIQDEVLHLKSHDSYMEKLACSFVLAQSINLYYFESSVAKLIQKTKYIPKEMKENGKISMSGKNISKLIGEILIEKHSINLHFNLLEKPDFFWEYPEFEKTYMSLSRYLEIENSTEVINKKLQVLHELVDVLSNEQKHRHGSFLEWIVIYLIVIEVIISLLGIFGIINH